MTGLVLGSSKVIAVSKSPETRLINSQTRGPAKELVPSLIEGRDESYITDMLGTCKFVPYMMEDLAKLYSLATGEELRKWAWGGYTTPSTGLRRRLTTPSHRADGSLSQMVQLRATRPS